MLYLYSTLDSFVELILHLFPFYSAFELLLDHSLLTSRLYVLLEVERERINNITMAETEESSILSQGLQKQVIDRSTGIKGGQDDLRNSKEMETTNTVPFYKLFFSADLKDKLLMIVGTIAAIGNGLNPPLMAFLFGELADAFGINKTKDITSVVCKVNKLKSAVQQMFVFHYRNFLD